MNDLHEMHAYLEALRQQYQTRLDRTPQNVNPNVVTTIKLQLVEHLLEQLK